MTSIPPDNQGRLERISTDRGLSMERQKTDFELERRSPPSESESPLRGAIANLLATERRETDRRLMVERRKSDDLLAARDSLLAVVSHDLRGLLAANEMYLEALRSLDVPLTSPKATAITDAMKDINAAMSRLLGDLLDAASIDCGKLLLTKKPTEIGPILRSVVGAFATGAAAKHIDLALECTGTTCPQALLDEQRILQVLANVLGNAIKFTPAGGRITVRLECNGKQATIAVADTGPGIAPSQLERIFERLAQTQPTADRSLGLGLFIARAIVEGHGGRIWAESALGEGSTFFVTLPLP